MTMSANNPTENETVSSTDVSKDDSSKLTVNVVTQNDDASSPVVLESTPTESNNSTPAVTTSETVAPEAVSKANDAQAEKTQSSMSAANHEVTSSAPIKTTSVDEPQMVVKPIKATTNPAVVDKPQQAEMNNIATNELEAAVLAQPEAEVVETATVSEQPQAKLETALELGLTGSDVLQSEPTAENVTDGILDSDNVINADNLSDSNTMQQELPWHDWTNLTHHSELIMDAVFLVLGLMLYISIKRVAGKVHRLAIQQSKLSQDSTEQVIEPVVVNPLIAVHQQRMETLQTEVASFVGCSNAMWDLQRLHNEQQAALEAGEISDSHYDWACRYNKVLQQAEALCAKIRLLVPVDGDASEQLVMALDKVMIALESQKTPAKLNDDVIRAAQTLLQQDWRSIEQLA